MAQRVTKQKEKVTKAAKPVVKKAKTDEKETNALSVALYDLEGKQSGTVTLAKEIFGQTVNKALLAQAVRVYLANKRQGTASTKTRGEVDGSTRKIYKQKGTGRARHGSVRAPIFVHGGVVFGPKPRDYSLSLPQKMKQKALFSALSSKAIEGGLKVIVGLETVSPKTKAFTTILEKLGLSSSSLLVVMVEEKENIKRASRNIQGVVTTGATRLNAYDVLKAKNLLVMKDALSLIEKHFIQKGK